MTKNKIRSEHKEKRKALDADKREELSVQIANQALNMPIWDKSFYHIYLPIEPLAEVNTEHLLSILSGKDKNIVISATSEHTRSLSHFLLTDNTVLKKNKWGIPEPQGGLSVETKMLDVVFVPLLAYDGKGNRLGYGKGYYDVFLEQCRPDCIKVGLSFFDPVAHVPTEKHDITLDACITADKIYSF